MSSVTLRIPGQPVFVRVARLAVSATASCAGFGVDQIDEIKQSVGEACLNAVDTVQKVGAGDVTIQCHIQDHQITIEVSPVAGLRPDDAHDDDLTSFEYFLIKTLMDEVEIVPGEAGLDLIRMTRSLTR
jgi:serine/threonine-protein kinase RsbW